MNKAFPHQLRTAHFADGRREMLEQMFVFNDPVEGRIEVPMNFVTDYASTPWFLWWILPPFGPYKFAAVIHDYLYKTRKFGGGWKGWRRADNCLYRAMCAVPKKPRWSQRSAIWVGLLLGGWLAFWKAGKQLEAVQNDWMR